MKNGIDLWEELGLEGYCHGEESVIAGVLEGATNRETGESVAEYAAHNEFGTNRIPSRPFLRQTFDEKAGEWAENLGKAVEAGYSPAGAFQLVGTRMAEDIQATIKSNMPPKNSEATINRKRKKVDGGARGESMVPGTLIDTGSLLSSIDYEVCRQ